MAAPKRSSRLPEPQSVSAKPATTRGRARSRCTLDPQKAAEFSLKLRIPGWAKDVTAAVNGQRFAVAAHVRNGYLDIRRMWARGDRVELDLPMPIERIYAHPAVRRRFRQGGAQARAAGLLHRAGRQWRHRHPHGHAAARCQSLCRSTGPTCSMASSPSRRRRR